jgi:hypothetical protein
MTITHTAINLRLPSNGTSRNLALAILSMLIAHTLERFEPYQISLSKKFTCKGVLSV